MNRLFTPSATTSLQDALSFGVAVGAGLREIVERVADFYGRSVVSCLRRLWYFRHVAVDTGHVVLTVNARACVSYSGAALSIGVSTES